MSMADSTRRGRSRCSPALVVATVALMVALGGTSYATVVAIPASSVEPSAKARSRDRSEARAERGSDGERREWNASDRRLQTGSAPRIGPGRPALRLMVGARAAPRSTCASATTVRVARLDVPAGELPEHALHEVFTDALFWSCRGKRRVCRRSSTNGRHHPARPTPRSPLRRPSSMVPARPVGDLRHRVRKQDRRSAGRRADASARGRAAGSAPPLGRCTCQGVEPPTRMPIIPPWRATTELGTRLTGRADGERAQAILRLVSFACFCSNTNGTVAHAACQRPAVGDQCLLSHFLGPASSARVLRRPAASPRRRLGRAPRQRGGDALAVHERLGRQSGPLRLPVRDRGERLSVRRSVPRLLRFARRARHRHAPRRRTRLGLLPNDRCGCTTESRGRDRLHGAASSGACSKAKRSSPGLRPVMH